MKFARYLDENTVPEWKRVYVQYRGLKKLIKRVAQHREARLHLDQGYNPTTPRDTNLRRRRANVDQDASGPSANISVQPISLEGTGLQLSHNHPDYASSSSTPPPQERDLEETAQHIAPPSEQQRQESTTIRYPDNVADPAAKTPNLRSNSSGASSKRGLLNRGNSLSHMSMRSDKSADMQLTLDELISTYFDQEEAKFFSVCDNELDRVTEFYDARESEAVVKYEQLVRQLQELAEHRREYRAKFAVHDKDKTILGGARNRLTQILSAVPAGILPTPEDLKRSLGNRGRKEQHSADDEKGKSREGTSEDRGDQRRAEALAHMQNSLPGWDGETDAEIRAANKAAALSHDPEAYATARKKLKATVLEYYKFLETLNNYRILNRTAFAKVMKKFSKTVGVPCANIHYKSRVAPSVLVTSDRITKLLKATEDIYAAYFEHGDRKQAMSRLRIRESHNPHHFSVFRTGIYLGISLCATVAGLIQALHPETQRSIPQWRGLLRVYGAEFLPVLFALLFGLNLAWWHHVRINTVFIFEWDIRHTMDHHQFFEIPALLMLLLSVFFWVSFVNPFPSAIAPTTWPAVWLVVMTLLMLNPLPIFLRDSRVWFVRSLLRVFTAGWRRVEFRDFFLGDELNSVSWSISNFWYIGCEWRHDWATPSQCAPNDTFWTAFLLSVPPLLRLGQCLRRWKDSDYVTHLHLVNGGKYTSAILNNFFYIHYRKGGSQADDLALWLVFACIAAIWHILWDVVMDWSLLRPRARYFLLRNELAFPVPVYYVFMLVDVIGRANWIVYLFPGSATVTLRSFLAALVEMIRRVCWNNLRVENEQIGNTDSFKVMRDLPLPYLQKLREDDYDARETKSNNRNGVFHMTTFGAQKNKATRAEASSEGVQNEDHSDSANANVSDTDNASPTLLERLRDKLVPDATGPEYGEGLNDRGATKGASGRDYVSRTATVDTSDEDLDSLPQTPTA